MIFKSCIGPYTPREEPPFSLQFLAFARRFIIGLHTHWCILGISLYSSRSADSHVRRSQIGEALLLRGKETDDADEERTTSEAIAPELDDVSPSQSLLEGGPKVSRPVNAGAVLVCYVYV